jgi:ribose/galactose isomerase
MTNGQPTTDTLCWPGRLLSADDLRRHLTGQREIVVAPRTIVTPLALDELRGKGVRIRREEQTARPNGNAAWAFAEETPDALVAAALAALAREGLALAALAGATPLQWARAVGSQVQGCIAFCGNAGLVCCLANKLRGVRAVAAANGTQATRARQTLGANFLAVEMPGRTVFELRQIVKAALAPAPCPAEIAKTLQELDGHAHR